MKLLIFFAASMALAAATDEPSNGKKQDKRGIFGLGDLGHAPLALESPELHAPIYKSYALPAPVYKSYSFSAPVIKSYAAPAYTLPAPVYKSYAAPAISYSAPILKSYAPYHLPAEHLHLPSAPLIHSAPLVHSAPAVLPASFYKSYAAPALHAPLDYSLGYGKYFH